MDVGNILVGGTQSCELTLLNNGVCSLKYVLSVEQMITGPCDPKEVANDPLGILVEVQIVHILLLLEVFPSMVTLFVFPTAIELDHYKGTICARGKIPLQVTLTPARQLHYTWSISYTISTSKGEKLGAQACTVTSLTLSV